MMPFALQVLLVHIRVGVLNELQYRVNLIGQLVGSLQSAGSSAVALWAVFAHTERLNGWTRDDLLILLGIFFLMRSAIQMIIQPSLQIFMTDIRDGNLDFALLKPVDAQFLVSVRRVSLWSGIDGVIGILGIVVGCARAGRALSPSALASFLFMFLCGLVIVYCFWMFLATCAFWFVKVENILVIFESLYQAGRWPVTLYPRAVQLFLTFIVPVAFAVTVPAEALTGRLDSWRHLEALALAVGLSLGCRLFWNLGIRHYSGASA